MSNSTEGIIKFPLWVDQSDRHAKSPAFGLIADGISDSILTRFEKQVEIPPLLPILSARLTMTQKGSNRILSSCLLETPCFSRNT